MGRLLTLASFWTAAVVTTLPTLAMAQVPAQVPLPPALSLSPPLDPLPPPLRGGCDGFAGTWDSDFGRIPMRVHAKRAVGSYTIPAGTIEAVVDGSQLDGRWTQRDRSGWLSFTLAADGRSFSGRWTEADGSGGGAWNGRCAGPYTAAAIPASHRREVAIGWRP